MLWFSHMEIEKIIVPVLKKNKIKVVTMKCHRCGCEFLTSVGSKVVLSLPKVSVTELPVPEEMTGTKTQMMVEHASRIVKRKKSQRQLRYFICD